MDFITRLPSSLGYIVIMVVPDRLSKYTHFTTLRFDYTRKRVVECLGNMVVKLHNFLKPLFFYRDKIFTSHFGQ